MRARWVLGLGIIAVTYAGLGLAADLRPDQTAAVDKIMATIEPSMRHLIRPQMEQAVQSMNPAQVQQFLAGALAGAEPVEDDGASDGGAVASPEDLAHNRAQYEPAMRKHWQAKKDFDAFVDAELAAKCPPPGKYAVYREAERYDLMSLSPNWQRAPDNKEAEIAVIGGTYAPQDGRYKFDFSTVRMSFDKSAVAAAITKACAQWTQEAVVFKEKAHALMVSGNAQAAFKLQGTAGERVSEIAATLESALDQHGPAGQHNAAMMAALQNPTRVN